MNKWDVADVKVDTQGRRIKDDKTPKMPKAEAGWRPSRGDDTKELERLLAIQEREYGRDYRMAKRLMKPSQTEIRRSRRREISWSARFQSRADQRLGNVAITLMNLGACPPPGDRQALDILSARSRSVNGRTDATTRMANLLQNIGNATLLGDHARRALSRYAHLSASTVASTEVALTLGTSGTRTAY